MFPEANSVLSALADASVRALFVVGIACLAAWHRPAATRRALFAAALLVMMLLPLATVVLPELPISVLPAKTTVTMETGAPVSPLSSLSVARGGTAGSRPVWPLAAAGLWLAVALALGFRVGWGITIARRLVRRATPIWDERFTSLPLRTSIRESRSVHVPLTVASAIVLPAEWRDWDDARLSAVLAHEAAHVRRRDWLTTVLAAINRSVFWFHPAAWWLERRLAVEAEHAADDVSLLATGDRRAYAELLLQMARNAATGRVVREALAMATASGVSRRIEAALDERRRMSAGLSRFAGACLVVSAAAVLALTAATRLAAQQPVSITGRSTLYIGKGPEIRDAAEAAEMEARLQATPEDQDSRLRLISHYNNRERDPERLMRHIEWFVQHAPTEPVNQGLASMAHAPDISRSHLLAYLGQWDAAVSSGPENSTVLINAASAWRRTDPMRAADLLNQARGKNPQPNLASLTLAGLYANALLNGKPEALSQRARVELESSDDPELVGAAAAILNPMRTRTNELGLFAARIVERARQLVPGIQLPDPERLRGVVGGVPANSGRASGIIGGVPGGIGPGPTGGVREGVPGGVGGGAPGGVQEGVSGAVGGGTSTGVVGGVPGGARGGVVGGVPSAGVATQRIRVGGNVQAANLIERVDPQYPPLARQARIQGIVRFTAIIAPDGTVQELQLTSGHPLLVPAAREAAAQWRYKPTLLNGSPVEVVTTIDVPFKLPE